MDFLKSYMDRLDNVNWEKTNRLLDEMELQAREIIERTCQQGIKVERFADIRHVGQGYEVITPVQGGKLSKNDLSTIKRAFNRQYQRLFKRTISGVPLEVLNWRVRVSGTIFKVQDPSGNGRSKETERIAHRTALRQNVNQLSRQVTPKQHREVYFEEIGGYVECPVHERSNLRKGVELTGPLIIEEKESTTVVTPGALCMLDHHGNLVLELREEQG
jgi:N-methylhydantoinase A